MFFSGIRKFYTSLSKFTYDTRYGELPAFLIERSHRIRDDWVDEIGPVSQLGQRDPQFEGQ